MIISVSGKINSGKDTVGKIIQILTKSPHFTDEAVVKFLERNASNPVFTIHKWADTLKDIVCLLIGCTRADLEDREFKEKELGEEWWYYQDAEKKIFPVNETTQVLKAVTDLIKPTPRLLLQLLGTECGRQIIHPNIWVNSLFSNYKEESYNITKKENYKYENGKSNLDYSGKRFPNWVITDTRFPNELKAVKDRGGITIRISRNKYPNGMYQIAPNMWTGAKGMEQFDKLLKKEVGIEEHESETALDNAEFDYVIDNNGSIEELVEKVREILTKENFV